MSDRTVAAVVLVLGVLAGVRVTPPARAAAPPPSAAVAAPDGGAGGTGGTGLEAGVTQGALRIARGGTVVECPLRHTDVQAEVSGFLARVRVTQTFENPYDEPIEAVYVFPLPPAAAVDDMTMTLGDRRVVGVVRRRAEARAVYEQALAQGQTASLLEQERPNIFTQSVGNIRPGQQVRIEIAYVDVLPYDRGAYEFHFPMVVGPRYIPGRPLGGPDQGEGWSPDTDRVPDASRLTPPVLKPGFRTGHDIALRVAVDAGVSVHDVRVATHAARVERPSRTRLTAVLSPADAIPNKDFVLAYKVAGERPETAVLAHAAPGEPGYFLLMMQPRDMEQALRSAPPRDICFLIDVSGSMSGHPTQKVIETMRRFFERMRGEDRIQVVTFAGHAERLFEGYLPAAPENLRRALGFTEGLHGGGGTEMLKGIRTVLADPVDPDRVRVVVMLTDGYIGNEAEIIAEVGRRAGDQLRFWTVGIGSSPNRFLLEGVARQGGGMSAVVGLNDDPTELAGRIAERLQRAQLSHIELDWGGLDVTETFPARVPELWAGRPVMLLGRYQGAGPVTVRISGSAEGQHVSYPLEVTFPERAEAHGVLAKSWARRKIEDLSDQLVVTRGDPGPLEEEITEVALGYRLMSAYTSFVAVDESEVPSGEEARAPRRVPVPLPMPEGVSYEGVFGDEESDSLLVAEAVQVTGSRRNLSKARPAQAGRVRMGGGVGGGVPGGVAGGIAGGRPAAIPTPKSAMAPPPPPPAMVAYDRAVLHQAEAYSIAPEGRADIAARGPEHLRQGREALARAQALAQARDWAGALRQSQLAWTLAVAHRRAQPWAADGTAARAADIWRQAGDALQTAAVASLPALGARLDVVVRNADLPAALDTVARAAGLTMRVTTGALEDAAALTQAPARVAYLDLRRATAAQALAWLVQPFGLEWAVEHGAVVVRSARRAPGVSAWTYDVKDFAQASDFESSAQRLVGGAVLVHLLGPDRLLVMGDAAAHAQATHVLTTLRKGGPAGGPQPAAALAGRVARALDQYTWALLSAACRGEVDDEAASELLEAVSDPDALAEVGRRQPVLLWRTGWVTAQARALAPADTTLGTVAARLAAVLPVASVPREPVAAAYLGLLRGLPSALRPAGIEGAPVTGPARAALTALGREPATGDDHAVLAALGQRLAGSAVWNAARDRRREAWGPGGVGAGALRVINRLERARLAGL